jgi:hypothetical protein
MPIELWKLPVPATSLVKGPDFKVLPKRQCEISFQIEGNEADLTRIHLLFDGVEAFKCTYLTSCSAEMFNTAYAKLVRLGATPWLTELLKIYGKGKQPDKELQHLMICFDDGPCYEIICLNFVEQQSE